MGTEVVYRFDRGELDGARHRLLVDGSPVELEPKAFAVLQDLLAHAGGMRSRDELLDAVWGHRHVTPAVLNRCIGQIRKALGDHADEPRYIQTVHTLGYRFIAPVEVQGAAAADAIAPTVAATPSPAHSRKRAWRIAAGVVVLALLGGLAWRSRDGASAPGELVARPPTQVVLVPFTVSKQAADLAPQVRALETAVLQRLRMLPGLRVERGQANAEAIVLTGSVDGPPDRRRLRVRVRNAGAPFDRTYPLQLTSLGDTAIGVQGDVVRLLRPDSADILEPSGVLDAGEYVRSGLRARQGLKRSDLRDAEKAFQRALQIDPTNADAWCFLGGLYLRPVAESMASKDTAVPRASDMIARGLRLDPASAHCLTKHGELQMMLGKIDAAETAFRRAMALEPSLYPPRAQIAALEFERGHYARWRDELERLVREHPEQGWTHCLLIDAYGWTGQPGKARALEPLVYERHPELRNVNWISASIELVYGHPAEGIRRLQHIAAFDPEDTSYPLTIAFNAAAIGDTALAKASIDKAGYLDVHAYLLAHTWLFYALGDPASAVAWLREAKVSPSLGLLQRALLAQSLALAGERDAALAEYARVYEKGWRDNDPAMMQGMFYLSAQLLNYASLLPPGAKRTDLIDAAERHLAAMRKQGMSMPWVHYQLAQIALLRDDRTTAIAALDRAIDAGYTDSLALSRDLPWHAVADDSEFAARKARLADIASEQRRLVAQPSAQPGASVGVR